MQTYAVHWFRRDLRLVGNPALKQQLQLHQGRVLGLFCFDKTFLERKDFSHRRFAFFLKTLDNLQQQMRTAGGDLLIVDAKAADFFPQMMLELKKRGLKFPTTVSWCEDYEPYAIERDELVAKLIEQYEIAIMPVQDHLLVHPQEMRKEDGTPYRVFTPFFKKWLTQLENKAKNQDLHLLQQFRMDNEQLPSFNLSWSNLFTPLPWPNSLNDFTKLNNKNVDIVIPDAGPHAILKSLKSFEQKFSGYNKNRDIPGNNATSKLSIYIKNGSLSTAQIVAFYDLLKYKNKPTSSGYIFLKEIAWREFYYNILYFFPYVEKNPFQFSCNKLVYENKPEYFDRWCRGQTGFPIVDAGMRELNSTGFMHNRLRMIVASFLTKDLLIDWRWGEHYFMQQLLDGDMASNNGGWQWAASTGTDAQPYFRIFNPWSQGLKFDPQGLYIKKYVPELKNMDCKMLHNPISNQEHYPTPIIDHKIQREKAIAAFKRLR